MRIKRSTGAFVGLGLGVLAVIAVPLVNKHHTVFGAPKALAAISVNTQTAAGNPVLFIPNSIGGNSTQANAASSDNSSTSINSDSKATNSHVKPKRARVTNSTSQSKDASSSTNTTNTASTSSKSNSSDNTSKSTQAKNTGLPASVKKTLALLSSEENSTTPLSNRISAVEDAAQSLEMKTNNLEAQWGATESQLESLNVPKSDETLYTSITLGYGNAFQQAFNIFNDVMTTNKQLVSVKTTAGFNTLDAEIINDEKDIAELSISVADLHSQIASLKLVAPLNRVPDQTTSGKAPAKSSKGK